MMGTEEAKKKPVSDTRAQRRMRMRPDRFADEPAPPFWPLFIEKLLLAIIDANPRPIPPTRKDEVGQIVPLTAKEQAEFSSIDRVSRLTVAMDALFLHGTRGRQADREASHLLGHTLEWHRKLVTDEIIRKELGGYKKIERVEALKIENLDLPESVPLMPPGLLIDFLPQPAGSTRKQKKSRALSVQKFLNKHRAYLGMVAMRLENEEEVATWHDLKVIAALLKEWKVDLKLDAADLGMMSIAPKKDALF